MSNLSNSSSESSTSGSAKRASTYSSDYHSIRGSQSSLNKNDTISIGSGQTTYSDKSGVSQTSESSLLSAFKARRSLDSQPKSLGLKDKCKVKMSVTSASNIPLPQMPVKKRSAPKKRDREADVEQKRVNTTHLPTLQSPTHLKRSSAVLDEDFDVFSLVKSQPAVAEIGLSPSRYFTSSNVDISVDGGGGGKRQCINRTAVKPKNSPTKSAMLRYRLRKTSSKLTLNASRSNIASPDYGMSPNKSDQPFTADPAITFKSPSKTSPYSQLILKNSPEKINLQSPTKTFNFAKKRSEFDKQTMVGTEKQNNYKQADVYPKQMQNATPLNKVVSSIAQKRLIKSPATDIELTVKPSVPRASKPSPKKSRQPSIALEQPRKKPGSILKKQLKYDNKVVQNQADINVSKQNSYHKDHEATVQSEVCADGKLSYSSALHKSKTAEIKTLPQSSKPGSEAIVIDGLDRSSKVSTQPMPLTFSLPKPREWKPAKKSSVNKTSSGEKGVSNRLNGNSTICTNDSPEVAARERRKERRLKSASTLDLKTTNKTTLSSQAYHRASVVDLNGSTATAAAAAHNYHLLKSGSMAKSLSNISCLSLLQDPSMVVYDSQSSLAQSSDSLASSLSTSQRSRSAKLAFLSEQPQQQTNTVNTLDQRLSKYKLSKSTRSTSNLSVSKLGLKSTSCTSLPLSTNNSSDTGNMKVVGTVTQV